MKVTLRTMNNKQKGKGYYYFDLFNGYELNDEGKRKAIRNKEFLGIFKYLNPKGIKEREHNKQSKNQAEAKYLQKQNDLFYSSNNLPKTYRASESFFKFWDKFIENKGITKKSLDSYSSCKKLLIKYKGDKIIIGQIDYSYCNNFLNFLKKHQKSNGENLSSSSINSYFKKLNEVLKELVKEQIINKNPCSEIKPPKVIHKEREFLNDSELKLLIKTKCRNESVKKFYLISCFTGLRHSDVVRLKWKNLIFEDTEGIRQYYLSFIIKKTGKPNKIPINNDALYILGERKGDDDLIVSGLKYSANNNNILREWSLLSGIKKIITPHTARHTFATRYLSQTNDIYGLQNLIGHKELKTTQVYMHLVDDKLKKNVNSLNSLME